MHCAVLFLSSWSQISWCEWHRWWKNPCGCPLSSTINMTFMPTMTSTEWLKGDWKTEKMLKMINRWRQKLCSHLFGLLYFQRVSVSPVLALERQRLYVSVSPPAHQNWKSNKDNKIKMEFLAIKQKKVEISCKVAEEYQQNQENGKTSRKKKTKMSTCWITVGRK